MADQVNTGGEHTGVWNNMITAREPTAPDTATQTKTKKGLDSHQGEAEDAVVVEGGEGEEGVVGTKVVAVYHPTGRAYPQLRSPAPRKTFQRCLDRLGRQVGSRASGQLLQLRSRCSLQSERRVAGPSR